MNALHARCCLISACAEKYAKRIQFDSRILTAAAELIGVHYERFRP